MVEEVHDSGNLMNHFGSREEVHSDSDTSSEPHSETGYHKGHETDSAETDPDSVDYPSHCHISNLGDFSIRGCRKVNRDRS